MKIMLRKKRLGLQVPVDYLGFEIPDAWVVGYGLDYADRYRTPPTLPHSRIWRNKRGQALRLPSHDGVSRDVTRAIVALIPAEPRPG